ncbi:MAG TPA: hypothetical protein VFX41_00590, partial [Actinomycetales bacterium]|nr:hypothetical protein [Actinomycetales bacterium]
MEQMQFDRLAAERRRDLLAAAAEQRRAETLLAEARAARLARRADRLARRAERLRQRSCALVAPRAARV